MHGRSARIDVRGRCSVAFQNQGGGGFMKVNFFGNRSAIAAASVRGTDGAHDNAPSPLPSEASGVATAEPTIEIIRKIRGGDAASREILVARYLPLLRRWAHGRLPDSARDLSDTDDLLQVTFIRVLNNLDQLRLERPGSFFLYLKQTVLNAIRDEIRRQRRKGISTSSEKIEPQLDTDANLDVAYGELDAYERALERLPKRQQSLIVMRLEFGLSYEEIAAECGSTPDAARMMVTRAVVRLTKLTGTNG
jgi:RNA polymerase sigma-70 factor (ECF subfamily)